MSYEKTIDLKVGLFFFDTKFYGHLKCRYSSGISQLAHDESFLFCEKTWVWRPMVDAACYLFFFSRECLISVFVLVFYPLVSSSSASAMSMASWNPLGVISHNRSHCRHGRYPAFMRLHFNHQTVPTGGKTSFPDICEARKEPLRVPSHAPSKGTTRLIDASSAVEDS